MQIESGVQLFSRISSSSSSFYLTGLNRKLFKDGGPAQNNIIEVFGTYSNEVLIDFIIRCILPKELDEEWKELEVVFVCITHQINILRITKALDAVLKKKNVQQNRKKIIEEALKRITILKCFSGEQTRLTLTNLENIIERNENISLLIVDNIASDYWLERQMQTNKLSYENYCKNNLKVLQNVVKSMNVVLVFARHEIGNTAPNLEVDYRIECSDSGKFFVYNTETSCLQTVPVQLHNNYITFL